MAAPEGLRPVAMYSPSVNPKSPEPAASANTGRHVNDVPLPCASSYSLTVLGPTTSVVPPKIAPSGAMVVEKANAAPMRSERSANKLSASLSRAAVSAADPVADDVGGASCAAEKRSSSATGPLTSAYATIRHGSPGVRCQYAM